MVKDGDTLRLSGLHIDGGGPGSMGIKDLRELARSSGEIRGPVGL